MQAIAPFHFGPRLKPGFASSFIGSIDHCHKLLAEPMTGTYPNMTHDSTNQPLVVSQDALLEKQGPWDALNVILGLQALLELSKKNP
jgi:hypothetical protein